MTPKRAERPLSGRVAWYAPVRLMAKVDQRDALEVLTRARLIELAQGFELDVSSRILGREAEGYEPANR
jgi:hypothetical protein